MKKFLSFVVVFLTTITLSFADSKPVAFLVNNQKVTQVVDTLKVDSTSKANNIDFQYANVEPYASNLRQITEATGVTREDLNKMFLKDAENYINIWYKVLIGGIFFMFIGLIGIKYEYKHDTGIPGVIALIVGVIFLAATIFMLNNFVTAKNNKQLYVTEHILKLLETKGSSE